MGEQARREAKREAAGAAGVMSPHEAKWLAWYMCALSFAFTALGLVLVALSRAHYPGVPVFGLWVEDALVAVGPARRPLRVPRPAVPRRSAADPPLAPPRLAPRRGGGGGHRRGGPISGADRGAVGRLQPPRHRGRAEPLRPGRGPHVRPPHRGGVLPVGAAAPGRGRGAPADQVVRLRRLRARRRRQPAVRGLRLAGGVVAAPPGRLPGERGRAGGP